MDGTADQHGWMLVLIAIATFQRNKLDALGGFQPPFTNLRLIRSRAWANGAWLKKISLTFIWAVGAALIANVDLHLWEWDV